MKTTLFALLLGAGLLTAGCASRSNETSPATPEVPVDETGTTGTTLGQVAPDFTLNTLDGDTFKLSDHRGEVVLINFWATWCGPCVVETPELVELYNDLKDRGLTVVGISLDEEGPEVVKPFAKRFAVSYPIAVDEGAVAEAFGGVYGLPTTYVVDGEGRITHRFIGIFPTDDMRPKLEELLQKTRADATG